MHKNTYRISIVIPIYNSEKYLNKCIDSILDQKFNGLEIILINDGSSDSSLDICNEYKDKYSNVKVITQKNSGPSSARNVGLDLASGEYICFIDSDDKIKYNYLSVLYDKAKENNCDVITCGYELGEKGKRVIPNFKLDTVLNGKEFVLSSKRVHTYNDLCFPWRYFYKLSTIKNNKIKFNEEITIGEDTIFNMEILLNSSRVMAIEDSLYCYTIDNPSSLMTIKYKPKLEQSLILQYRKRIELSNKYGLNKDENYSTDMAEYYINNIYTLLLNNIKNNKNLNIKEDIKRVINLEMITDSIKILGNGYKRNSIKEKLYYLAIKFKIYPVIILIFKKSIDSN